MDKVKELIENCKSSVSILVNEHKPFFQTVKEYLNERLDNDISNISIDVYAEMQKTNTIIEIQVYSATNISSYTVYHYDIDTAFQIALDCIKSDNKSYESMLETKGQKKGQE